MMFLRNMILISVLFISLSACRGLGGGNDVNVTEFEITGSSSVLEEGRVGIDTSINDGIFNIAWTVDDDGAFSYTAGFYLSVNPDLSDNDIRFATVYCDEVVDCDADKRNDEYCYFTNSLEMYCGDKDNNIKYDIDELIDQLPEDLYIIIEACNFLDCDTEAVPVRLR